MTSLVFLFITLTIPYVLGDCTCTFTSSNGTLYCYGDSALYLGDTSLFVGDWTLCTSTIFYGSFLINNFNYSQELSIPDGGSLSVTGDLVIPATIENITVQITQGTPSTSNSTLEVFGNLIVAGNLNISVSNVIVHGSVIIQPSGTIWITGVNSLYVQQNFNLSGNSIFQGSPNITNATIIIDQSFISSINVPEIYFAFYNVIIKGDMILHHSPVTIAAITNTSISAKSATYTMILLQMLDVDKGLSNLNKQFQPLILDTMFNGTVNFTKEWSCGSYNVVPIININYGISISLLGSNLSISDTNYCCFEDFDECTCAQITQKPIPSYCIPQCDEWICEKTGFVVGWIIGGAIIVAILSVSCFLFCTDFLSS